MTILGHNRQDYLVQLDCRTVRRLTAKDKVRRYCSLSSVDVLRLLFQPNVPGALVIRHDET